jgi:hypothetical protein
MGQTVQTDDELTFVAPPLRLTFRWDGRRWSHELAVSGRTVASSLEWEPGRDDPARVISPSYQQLSFQESEGGRQGLLVGQWGHHHGSAVFGVNEAASGVVVDVDVAVRSRAPLLALASTYLVDLTSSDLTDAGPSSVVWEFAPAPAGGWLRFEADEPWRVGLAEAGRRATRVQATAEVAPTTATHRLRYRWNWVNRP